MGVVPGPIGLAADLMNAGIYWLQGDWEMALKYIGFGVSTFFGGKVIGVLANTGKVGRIASGVIIGVIGGAGIYNGGSMAANALIGYLPLGPNATREQKAEYVSRIIIGLANVYYGANNFATGVEAVHNAVREPLPEIENPDGRETVYNRPDDNVRGPEALPQKDKIPPTDNLIICGSNCFVEGTKIAAADGLKNIEDIEEGDEVYSYDPETGRSGLKKVTHIFESEKNELTDVTIRKTDTTENTVETITSTTTHPYYVKGIGFKYAKDLEEGDRLQLLDGTYAEVICIKTYTLDESVKVYNFEVEDWHTYYVGTESILVHNMCVTKGGSGYYKDANGRWHRPNGQFASNAEMGIDTPVNIRIIIQASVDDGFYIYQTVGVDEYYDIIDTERFRGVDGALAANTAHIIHDVMGVIPELN